MKTLVDKKVSVVIPYYNNEKTILRALESVLNQEYTNIEIIMINDGSKDNSFRIVEEYIDKKQLKIINLNQENKGPSNARNIGIKKASGEYIAFLDADDSWEKNKLSVQMNLMIENDMDMLGCNFYINIGNEKKKQYFIKEKIKKIELKHMIYKHYYATPCVICKKKIIQECGMFDENKSYMEDSLLFSKIARDYRAYMSNEFLVNTYKNSYGESGLSSELVKMQKHELDNFMVLYSDNNKSKVKLNLLNLIFSNVFSMIKFVRRIIKVKIVKKGFK